MIYSLFILKCWSFGNRSILFKEILLTYMQVKFHIRQRFIFLVSIQTNLFTFPFH